MPKISNSLALNMRQWIASYNTPVQVFTCNGRTVTCLVCAKDIVCFKKYHVDSHSTSASHIAAIERAKKSKFKQTTIAALPEKGSTTEFYKDLCNAMVGSNIPLHKLKTPCFNEFLSKYIGLHVPDKSTLRKNYLPNLYKNTIEKIQEHIGDNPMYIMVDETTDARGFYIVNLIMGPLTSIERGNPFLISCGQLKKTNAASICNFIHDKLNEFFRGQQYSDKIRLFVSDAALYMVSAGEMLKHVFLKMIHVICIVHGIHRVCEKLREMFPDVNTLISSSRKVFLKCPARIQIYREIMNCSLPPEVVITRWGTWIKAALFYAEYYEKFQTVVENLQNDSAYIKKLKNIIQSINLVSDLAFLQLYALLLLNGIDDLQSMNLSLNKQISIVEDIIKHIDTIPGNRGKQLKEKINNVFNKNTGYGFLKKCDSSINLGECVEKLPYTPGELSVLRYASLTSVDIERSFSYFKHLLTDRRYNFTEILNSNLVVGYNTKFLC